MKRALTTSLIAIACVAGGGYWYETHQKAQTAQNAASTPERTGAASSGKRGSAGPTSVVTAAATKTEFPVRLTSIGYVEPIAIVAVKSRVQSQLLQQNFTDGQMVKKGDLLFVLDDREFAAQVEKDQAAIARDQATLTRSQNDLARAQQLIARNAGTQQALDQATADTKTSQAALQGDQAALDTDKLRLSYTKIYAPIEGRAGTVSVTPGNLVNASDSGSGLVTITQMKPLRVSFTLPERNLAQVQSAMTSKTPPQVKVSPHGGSKDIAVGKLNFIDSAVDQASGTITLKAEFPNDDMKLWPGEYCDIEVELGVHPDAVSIPTVALQTGQNGSFVFVVSGDSTAQIRNVTTGLTDGDRSEILTGIEAGDKVVVDGQLRLANGAAVRETTAANDSNATTQPDRRG